MENKDVCLEQLSDRLLSVPEAAELLHLQENTLQNWLSQRKHGLKRLKVGRKTFVDKLIVRQILLETLEK